MCAKYRRGNVLSVWALNRALAKQKRQMGQKEACKSPTPGRHFADFKMVGGALARRHCGCDGGRRRAGGGGSCGWVLPPLRW